MQFDHALDRLLRKILLADPKFSPVELMKVDMSDGFYRVGLNIDDIPKLGVAFPTQPGEEQLVALPLILPMGWKNSPSRFLRRHRDDRRPGQPAHRGRRRAPSPPPGRSGRGDARVKSFDGGFDRALRHDGRARACRGSPTRSYPEWHRTMPAVLAHPDGARSIAPVASPAVEVHRHSTSLICSPDGRDASRTTEPPNTLNGPGQRSGLFSSTPGSTW